MITLRHIHRGWQMVSLMLESFYLCVYYSFKSSLVAHGGVTLPSWPSLTLGANVWLKTRRETHCFPITAISIPHHSLLHLPQASSLRETLFYNDTYLSFPSFPAVHAPYSLFSKMYQYYNIRKLTNIFLHLPCFSSHLLTKAPHLASATPLSPSFHSGFPKYYPQTDLTPSTFRLPGVRFIACFKVKMPRVMCQEKEKDREKERDREKREEREKVFRQCTRQAAVVFSGLWNVFLLLLLLPSPLSSSSSFFSSSLHIVLS